MAVMLCPTCGTPLKGTRCPVCMDTKGGDLRMAKRKGKKC